MAYATKQDIGGPSRTLFTRWVRPRSDVEVLVDDMVAREPLISENRKPQLRRLIYKLIEKLEENEVWDYMGART